MKAIKSDSDSDSDEQKRLPGFSGKNRGATPSVAAPGVTHPSDATGICVALYREASLKRSYMAPAIRHHHPVAGRPTPCAFPVLFGIDVKLHVKLTTW